MGGRGKTSSLTQEQLQTLGVGKDHLPVQTTPPPTYPPLISKPVSTETSATQNFQILWKENFLNNMRDSPYFLVPKISKIALQNASETSKTKAKPEFNWSLLPSELQPTNRKRRRVSSKQKADDKTAKAANIEDRLKVLEEKERTENDGQAKGKNSDSEKEDDAEEDQEAAADEEMDDENDYGNSYFDNGEAYNEEDDDNLDDGPVY